MFNVKFLSQLAAAGIEGEAGILEQIIQKKLEGEAEHLVMRFLGGPLGLGQRVQKAVATGGQSEFDQTRDRFLRPLTPHVPHGGLIRKLDAFIGAGGGKKGRFKRRGKYGWQATDWASSRDDWLDNRWRHDWRSQPRDQRGRWIPGRLEYIAAQLQYRGKRRVGRTVLRRRKLRKLRRLATRRELRKILKTNRDAD
jgi:hypothetical protein